MVDDGEARPAHEPDYRFSLANERTYLAWIRTSVGLMAAGVAIVKLVPGDNMSSLRRVLGVLLGLLGLLVAGAAWSRFRAVQRAMANNQPMPRAVVLPLLGLGLIVSGALVLVLVVS